MDVLTALLRKADERRLLQPLTTKHVQHRLSVYADDVIIFATPTTVELKFIKDLLEAFGTASGLQTNMAKSSILPIRCQDEHVAIVHENIDCHIAQFPCRYLGLPLSIRRLRRIDLQPILDKIADRLPTWKATLLQRSGRLILVKMVLTAIPIHLLLAIDAPKWFIRAIDKFRRGFLWQGYKDCKGGQCPVAWLRVTRPLQLGGLGVQNLEILAWSLRMRWMWKEKTDPTKPWAVFPLNMPGVVTAMFKISVTMILGDGKSAMFWTDRWLQGKSIGDAAPALIPFVCKRGWRKRTVYQALQDNAWLQDVIGGLPVLAAWHLVQLWAVIQQIQLQDELDGHCWTPSATGEFTTKSAYQRFFVGSTEFEPHKRLWKSWAPLKVKIFMWLALLQRCWTADKLARRGLPHPERCPFCDQDDETIDHLLIKCVYAREAWYRVLSALGIQPLIPTRQECVAEWWRWAARKMPRDKRKGFNSLVMLVCWTVWKRRNRCVFDNVPPRMDDIVVEVRREASLWGIAGAKRLQNLL